MMILNRRRFTRLLLVSPALPLAAQGLAPAGRRLDFTVASGFGEASADDIRAVVNSAAGEIWKHCPATRWETTGFHLFPAEKNPITLFKHTVDGRVAIGLTPRRRLWAQFAFQFAHEFCHALAGHANDWRTAWIAGKKANHWLEESLCETASLFALRAMARTWVTAPPYRNWNSYAPSLASYAADRLAETESAKGRTFVFRDWFAAEEPSLRGDAAQREKNNIVAAELLPIFEAEPRSWEALAFFNRTTRRDPEKSLAEHFLDWSAASPEELRPLIARIRDVF